MDLVDFTGVKAALLLDDQLLLIQRDQKPGLRFAGLWDFPGGGREDEENPFEYAAREVEEELGITLYEGSIVFQRIYPALHDPTIKACFMVIQITEKDVATIRFGNEGQGWKLLSIDEFMQSDEVVPPLKDRLQDYLNHVK